MPPARTQAAALVRGLRQTAGLTQAALGRRLGISQSAVAQLESGKANPELATLARAVEALGHDLVVEARPRPAPGLDESLIRRQLALSPAERVAAFEAAYRNVRGSLHGVG